MSRPTAFQTLMRGWSELAPYNFIHAFRLAEPQALARWQAAIAQTQPALRLEISEPSVELATTDLATHLDAELNRAFTPGAAPVRFFVVDNADDGHWFGAVFDHWHYDDFAGRALLERIYAAFVAGTVARRDDTAPRVRRNWLRELQAFGSQTAALRHASRISLRDPLDLTARSFHTALPAGALENVHRLRKGGATVHDVFLAAVAQACGASGRWPARGRRDAIGVVSAMNLRGFDAAPTRIDSNFRIGQYTIVERAPEKLPLPDLAARIAERTRRLKAVTGAPVFATALLFWRLARSRHARANLYQRGSPLAAGLSNVNLTGSWIEHSPIVEYRRVGPTGPIVPLTFMITTLRGRIFFDTTYRVTAFTRDEAEHLVADVIDRLTR